MRDDYTNRVNPNYEASGKHNQEEFFNYCNGDTDILYLHCWLNKLNNPELSSYCAEGD